MFLRAGKSADMHMLDQSTSSHDVINYPYTEHYSVILNKMQYYQTVYKVVTESQSTFHKYL